MFISAIGVWLPPFVTEWDCFSFCISIATFALPTILNTNLEQLVKGRKSMEDEMFTEKLIISICLPLCFLIEIIFMDTEWVLIIFTIVFLVAVILSLWKHASEFLENTPTSPMGGNDF